MQSLKVLNSSSNKNSVLINSEKYLLTPQSLPKGSHRTYKATAPQYFKQAT